MANPLGLPLGLQLYSVREMLPTDYEGTLRKLGAMGYREVEAAGFFGRNPHEVKRAMDGAELRCVSAHYPLAQLLPALEETIQYAKDLGLEYVICSAPMPMPKNSPAASSGVSGAKESPLTLDDWRWNAGQFNRIAEKTRAAGIRFGYHNHVEEFRELDGLRPYDELLRLTDPASVTMEMDCGWVIVGGQSPADYLARYPKRFSMLHVKDFKLSGATAAETAAPRSTEMGRGSIDYRPIFRAARQAGIAHIFVEQEEFDIPPLQALKIDAAYMQAFKT
jgi:sugar phosphate isomerase/epimerase